MQKIFFYFGDFGILVDYMTRGETVNQNLFLCVISYTCRYDRYLSKVDTIGGLGTSSFVAEQRYWNWNFQDLSQPSRRNG